MARILVAEDDAAIRELIRHGLERDGHAVEEADSGPQALEAALRGKTDLLIMDVMLPGMDGHTLLMELSRRPATQTLPVLVITAVPSSRPLFEKFSQVKAFVPKPFKPADLSALAVKALAGSQGA
ncbi:MAG: response regulator [Elusimicrobiota bacterium]